MSSLEPSGQEFLSIIDEIVQSVKIHSNTDELTINPNIEFSKYEIIDDFFIPSISNSRLRSSPDLNSEILGYVQDIPYRIIGIGPEFEADGIRGNWYRIKTYIGPTTGWAFSGYLRVLTEEEKAKYFEGI